MNFEGTCQAIYNIIDAAHVESKDKKIYITPKDPAKIRRWWGTRYGRAMNVDPITGAMQVIVHVRGRLDLSHLVDRPASFRVTAQPSFGGRQRVVYVSSVII